MRGVRGPCGPGNGREDGIQPAFRLSVLMGQGTLMSLANGCRHGDRFTRAQAIPLINLGRGNIIPGCRNRPPPPPPPFVSPVLCGPGFGWCVLCLVRSFCWCRARPLVLSARPWSASAVCCSSPSNPARRGTGLAWRLGRVVAGWWRWCGYFAYEGLSLNAIPSASPSPGPTSGPCLT